MLRVPQYAGLLYEDEKNLLEQQISTTFNDGPGDHPAFSIATEERFGAIVPQGPYSVCGPISAWAYKELAESKRPEVIVLLGAHPSSDKTATSILDWQTPLGLVRSAVVEVRDLRGLGIPIDEELHKEHPMEIQLPFLQYIFKEDPPEVLFVSVGTDVPYKKLAASLKKVLGKKHFWCIVSAELSRFGDRFGHTPFVYNILESVQNQDKGAISFMQKMDANGMLAYMKAEHMQVQARVAIATALELLKNDAQAEEVHYSLLGNTKECIGYGALVFR